MAACLLVGALGAVLWGEALSREQSYLLACLTTVLLIPVLLGTRDGLISRLFSFAPLRHLGRISYSAYLLHLLIRNVVYHYRPAGSTLGNAALTIAITVAISALSWKLLESRLLRRGRPVRARSNTSSAFARA